MATVYVSVVSGQGRWAYWRDKDKKEVVADSICNIHVPHFAGKLAQECLGTPCENAEMFTTEFQEERPRSIYAMELERYYGEFADD